MPLPSSFYRPASVYQWHAHSMALMAKTLYIGQRYTIPCPLISYRLLRCTHTFSPPRESSFTSLCHYYPPSTSTVSTATSRPPNQVNSHLFPPPHPYSCAWIPFHYHRCIRLDFEYFSQILYGFIPVTDKGMLFHVGCEVILR